MNRMLPFGAGAAGRKEIGYIRKQSATLWRVQRALLGQ
jgi:hypothetical protein